MQTLTKRSEKGKAEIRAAQVVSNMQADPLYLSLAQVGRLTPARENQN